MVTKNKLIKLEEYKPHITISLIDGDVLVVPTRYIEELIDGKQKLKITKDNEILLRTIIQEWYSAIEIRDLENAE